MFLVSLVTLKTSLFLGAGSSSDSRIICLQLHNNITELHLLCWINLGWFYFVILVSRGRLDFRTLYGFILCCDSIWTFHNLSVIVKQFVKSHNKKRETKCKTIKGEEAVRTFFADVFQHIRVYNQLFRFSYTIF